MELECFAKIEILVRYIFQLFVFALRRNYCWSMDPLDAAPESKLGVDVDSHASAYARLEVRCKVVFEPSGTWHLKHGVGSLGSVIF